MSPKSSEDPCQPKSPKHKHAVVVSGMAGKFPESDNMEELRDNLLANVDMVTVKDRRWRRGVYGIPERMGTLKDITKFDTNFFSVHAKQVEVMDPQIRLMLELTQEAILDAGINPEDLRGTNTGVYVGASSSESGEILMSLVNELTGYELTGAAMSMFSNRLSYSYDLRGPSVVMDTACSSSLMAFHSAASAIRSGEIDAAIVGGCHICIKPAQSVGFHRLNMLSPDGKCKVFDDSGNGYARSETVSVVFLQKAADAKRIYAHVVNTGTNCDGNKKEGITYPSGNIQKELILRTFKEVNIDPTIVEYVEAHGTGTTVGDPQELGSIAEVFCKGRKTPLLIGAVKSNLGHAEPASGVGSLAKSLIAMETGIIPANLHFKIPNKEIASLLDGRIKVVDKNTKWNPGYIALNSFGFGGSNVHVILKSNDKVKQPSTDKPTLVCLSGRTEEAVDSFLQYIESMPRDDEYIALIHNIYKTHVSGYNYRGYAIIGANEPKREIVEESGKREVWYMFTGMGCQWPGMGKAFMCLEPFSNAIHICAKALKNVGVDLVDIVENANEETFENLINCFVCNAAIQVALIDVLSAMGIKPDKIVGHSAGEVACGYADGCMTREQTVLSAYWRGWCTLDCKPVPGQMAAVGLSWDETTKRLPPSIIIACHNGENSVTISGPEGDVEKFIDKLKSEDIFAKKVASSRIAFHSKYVTDAAAKLQEKLEEVIPEPKLRSKNWYSSSIPENQWTSKLAKTCSPAYYVNNLVSPVLFHDQALKIPEGAVVIEIGPHAIFQAILKKTAPKSCLNIGLVSKFSPNHIHHLMANVGKLFIAGQTPNYSLFHPPVTFPVGRGTPTISARVKWDHAVSWKVANYRSLLGLSGTEFRSAFDISYENDAYIKGHCLDGRVLFPAAGYITLAWRAIAYYLTELYENVSVTIENLDIIRATVMPKDKAVTFCVNLNGVTGGFEISEGGSLVVTGSISVGAEETKTPETRNKSDLKGLEKEEIYRDLSLKGYNYDGHFKGIKSCDNIGETGVLEWRNNWISYIDTMLQFSLVGKNSRLLYLPTRILRITIDPKKHLKLVEGKEDIEVQMYKNVDIIRSGGVEIKGLKATQTQRKIGAQATPKLEKYCFIPYNIKKEFPIEDALTVLVQIILENSKPKLKIAEVYAQDVSEVVSPVLVKILDTEPMTFPEISVHCPNPEEHKALLQPLNIKLEKEFESTELDLVITSNLGEGMFNRIVASVHNGGFIMSFEEREKELGSSLVENVSKIRTEKGFIYLLRKIESWTMPQLIEVKSDLNWFDKVKQALKVAQKTDKKFVLVSDEAESGLMGMFNCLKLESGGQNFRCISLRGEAVDLSTYKDQLKKDLLVNIYKGGEWGSMRHITVTESVNKDVEFAFINTLTKGDLSSFRWFEGPSLNPKLERDPNIGICTVYYSALNFKDVMLASGKLPPDALSAAEAQMECCLGLEVAGRDSQGQRIMASAILPGMATYARYNKIMSWKIPEKWTMEQGATIPTVYSTVYYALFLRGDLKRHESILIHAGSGGVGQAAIRVALSMDCEIFTTVGTPQKKEFLLQTFPSLKEENIGCSRDTSFEQMIMERTKGEGVDLVLNSLAGDLLHASIRCLASYGRFLEIGKYDISKDTKIGMAVFLKSASLYGIHLDRVQQEKGSLMEQKKIQKMIQEGIETGVVQPLQTTVYPHLQVEQAFRFFASGKHIGKVILEIKKEEDDKPQIVSAIPRIYMNPRKSYIVLGGLGGIGLELANWLLAKGAHHVVLGSSRGVSTGYQAMCLRRWKELGHNVTVSTQDTSKIPGAEMIIKEANSSAPVGGIFNLAAVLRDSMFENSTKEDFQAVCKVKIDTTRCLDIASRKLCPELDYFVAFSSLACGRGNIGQTNYGYANSAMEMICESRRTSGLPALAMQWGAVGDVGLVIDGLKATNETVISGTLPQRIISCFQTLERFLLTTNGVFSSMVLAERGQKSKDKTTRLEDIIANILGIKSSKNIANTVSLGDLGIDSLMGAEIKQILENYDCMLNPTEIRVLTFGQLREIDSGNKTEEKPEKSKRGEQIVYSLVPKNIVVQMKKGTGKKPWFFIHGIEGTVEPLTTIAELMEIKEEIYGLQCTKDVSWNSVEEMAAVYIKEIKKIQPKGPYKIMAYSFGCTVTFAMASQIEKKEKISIVFLDGSPAVVSTYLGLYMKNRNRDPNESDAFAYFASVIAPQLDFQETHNIMKELPDYESRLRLMTSILKKHTQYDEDDLYSAADSFYNKLALSLKFKPTEKIASDITLIKATENFVAVDVVLSVQNLCKKDITVHTVEGDHRSILQGESGKKIAQILSRL